MFCFAVTGTHFRSHQTQHLSTSFSWTITRYPHTLILSSPPLQHQPSSITHNTSYSYPLQPYRQRSSLPNLPRKTLHRPHRLGRILRLLGHALRKPMHRQRRQNGSVTSLQPRQRLPRLNALTPLTDDIGMFCGSTRNAFKSVDFFAGGQFVDIAYMAQCVAGAYPGGVFFKVWLRMGGRLWGWRLTLMVGERSLGMFRRIMTGSKDRICV